MNTYIAYERGEISIPLNLIFNQAGRLDINDSISKYFSLSYRAKENRLILYAGKYIGYFRLNDLIVVNVRPKFDISNLKRILLLSDNKIEILNFLYANYERALVDDFSQSLIIKVFNERLIKIYSDGFIKEYILKEESSASIRGRININRSMQKHWSRGEINKVEISYYNYTEDNIFNKVIKKSIELSLQLVKDGLNIHSDEIKSLLFYYSLLESVDSDFTYNEYLSFKDKIYKISSLRDYYIPLCQICNLIIEKKGIDFNFQMNGGEIANSFILNMESVFESYLLNVLSSGFKGNLSLKDGNKAGKKKLFNDADHDAQPDYILYENSVAKIILDAKYKSKISESDRYQIISHSLSYNCHIAILILPLSSNMDRVKRIGTIGEDFKIILYEYYFDLTSKSLEHEELQMIESIKQILRGVA